MARPPLPLLGEEVDNGHAQLTQAHTDAVESSALLKTLLLYALPPEPVDAKKQAINLGAALERVACAERACGSCYGHDHTFSKAYEEMLENHRLAFVDFERLSCELASNPSPSCTDIAALAADIEHHLKLAEQGHKRAMGKCAVRRSPTNK